PWGTYIDLSENLVVVSRWPNEKVHNFGDVFRVLSRRSAVGSCEAGAGGIFLGAFAKNPPDFPRSVCKESTRPCSATLMPVISPPLSRSLPEKGRSHILKRMVLWTSKRKEP